MISLLNEWSLERIILFHERTNEWSHSLNYSLTHSLTLSLTHPLTHYFSLSLTPSLTLVGLFIYETGYVHNGTYENDKMTHFIESNQRYQFILPKYFYPKIFYCCYNCFYLLFLSYYYYYYCNYLGNNFWVKIIGQNIFFRIKEKVCSLILKIY